MLYSVKHLQSEVYFEEMKNIIEVLFYHPWRIKKTTTATHDLAHIIKLETMKELYLCKVLYE